MRRAMQHRRGRKSWEKMDALSEILLSCWLTAENRLTPSCTTMFSGLRRTFLKFSQMLERTSAPKTSGEKTTVRRQKSQQLARKQDSLLLLGVWSAEVNRWQLLIREGCSSLQIQPCSQADPPSWPSLLPEGSGSSEERSNGDLEVLSCFTSDVHCASRCVNQTGRREGRRERGKKERKIRHTSARPD